MSFLLIAFYWKNKTRQKSWSGSFVELLLKWKKNMIRGKIWFMKADVWHPQDVTFATKNIYSLWFLRASKAFERFPGKHSWWSHFSNRYSEQSVCNSAKRRTLPPKFFWKHFGKWMAVDSCFWTVQDSCL